MKLNEYGRGKTQEAKNEDRSCVRTEMNFEYFAPTKVVFGKDAEQQAGRLVKEQGGTKVLIHYGGSSALRSGLIDRVRKSLADQGIPFCELGGVVPNPRLSKVRE